MFGQCHAIQRKKSIWSKISTSGFTTLAVSTKVITFYSCEVDI